MDNANIIKNRLEKLNELKLLLGNVDDRLLNLTKELNWDHNKLLEESTSSMVTCSINPQHRVPAGKLKGHEQKCILHHHGYGDREAFFPEHSGAGSFVSLTSETLHLITQNVPSCRGNKIRNVPETCANFDQNFNREEKLAIYDYVIANTKKQNSYSDLWLQTTEKSEEKREMTAWEMAAAERDAKRRRPSYRNKVHTNRKTHTEILREVIESQMEALKEDGSEKPYVEVEGHKASDKKPSHDSRNRDKQHKSRHHHEVSSGRGNREDRDKRRNREKHTKHRDRKRSPPDTGSDIKSRSRSDDKYRKWKSYEGRSHSHRSGHTHRR